MTAALPPHAELISAQDASFKQLLREQRQRLPEQVKYHCVDGYFAKKKYIDEVVALPLSPIPERASAPLVV